MKGFRKFLYSRYSGWFFASFFTFIGTLIFRPDWVIEFALGMPGSGGEGLYAGNRIVFLLFAGLPSILTIWFLSLGFRGLLREKRHARDIVWLKANGKHVSAKITDVVHLTNHRVNMQAPYVVRCEWTNPEDKKTYKFESDWIWVDPFYPSRPNVDVFYDPQNPARYFIDRASLGVYSNDELGSKEAAEAAQGKMGVESGAEVTQEMRKTIQQIGDAIGSATMTDMSKEGIAAAARNMSGEAVKKIESARQTKEVFGAPGRPLPGEIGGGTTSEQAAALADSGEQATAKVLAVEDVNYTTSLPDAPSGTTFTDIIFEVRKKDGSMYRTRSRIGFSAPERRARIAKVGVELPVRIDPNDASRIAVDVKALDFRN